MTTSLTKPIELKTKRAAVSPCSLLSHVGNTPMVELQKVKPHKGARILAKLEGSNPGGSVKDRPALWMIEQAEKKGILTPGKIILEPTSGNTGIGLAMVGAFKGYRVKLALPGCVSTERRQTLLAYGAELVITPHNEKTDGAIREAHKIMEEYPDRYFMPNQFANPGNWKAHYETTAKEIIEQTGGEISAFVAGLGTSGTLMGTSRRLKEHDPNIRIVATLPPVGDLVQGLRSLEEGFIPPVLDESLLDERMVVNSRTSFAAANELLQKEGIFAGVSSGAAMHTAQRVAQQMDEGKIVVLLPDGGWKYLSMPLDQGL